MGIARGAVMINQFQTYVICDHHTYHQSKQFLLFNNNINSEPPLLQYSSLVRGLRQIDSENINYIHAIKVRDVHG